MPPTAPHPNPLPPPYQDTLPEDKIMFPYLAPKIRPDDPRVLRLHDWFKQKLEKPPKGTSTCNLEFEIKLGNIKINPYAPSDSQMKALIETNKTWELLPHPKSLPTQPVSYNFTPSLKPMHSVSKVDERTAF